MTNAVLPARLRLVSIVRECVRDPSVDLRQRQAPVRSAKNGHADENGITERWLSPIVVDERHCFRPGKLWRGTLVDAVLFRSLLLRGGRARQRSLPGRSRSRTWIWELGQIVAMIYRPFEILIGRRATEEGGIEGGERLIWKSRRPHRRARLLSRRVGVVTGLWRRHEQDVLNGFA